jgi:hypothetical protein
VPIDFHANGYLERTSQQSSSASYKHVRDGTLKELVEYVWRRRPQIELYRITIGTKKYTGQEIKDLYDDPNFPKSN